MKSTRDNKRFEMVADAAGPVDASYWWAGLVLFLFGSFLWGRPHVRAVVPTPQPVEKKLSRWDQMGATLTEMADHYDGEVGIYIKDLKTGRTFERNADQRFVSASLIKLPIMAATCQAIKENRLSLNTRIKFRNYERRDGSGNLKWVRAGRSFPLSQLVYAMITQSDNTATAMVIDRLGYEFLNRCFADFGLQETRIHPQGMSLANSIDPLLDNYTTPHEMGHLLEKIYNHQLVSDGLSDLMLEIMKHARSRSRLAKNLPPEWQFARKTGLLRHNCHDVGIVFTPDGGAYVLCVLTGQNNNYKLAKSLISSVGRMTYEFIDQPS